MRYGVAVRAIIFASRLAFINRAYVAAATWCPSSMMMKRNADKFPQD